MITNQEAHWSVNVQEEVFIRVSYTATDDGIIGHMIKLSLQPSSLSHLGNSKDWVVISQEPGTKITQILYYLYNIKKV